MPRLNSVETFLRFFDLARIFLSEYLRLLALWFLWRALNSQSIWTFVMSVLQIHRPSLNLPSRVQAGQRFHTVSILSPSIFSKLQKLVRCEILRGFAFPAQRAKRQISLLRLQNWFVTWIKQDQPCFLLYS